MAAVFSDAASPTTGDIPATNTNTTTTTDPRGINLPANPANLANLNDGRNPESIVLQLLYNTLPTDTSSSLESTSIVNNTPLPPWKLNIPLSSLITTSTTHTSTSKKELVSNIQGSAALASKDPMQIFLSSLPDFSYLLKPASDIVPAHLQ